MTFTDRTVYVGTFKGGKRSAGKVTKDGLSVYDGSFADDLYHGDGVLFHLGAPRYSGQFALGERHGLGTELGHDRKIESEWERGRRRDGDSSITYADGARFEGKVVRGGVRADSRRPGQMRRSFEHTHTQNNPSHTRNLRTLPPTYTPPPPNSQANASVASPTAPA